MNTFDLLKNAKNNGYALGAFNVANTETLKAVVRAGVNLKSPLIIEASDGEINYLGMSNLVSLIQNYRNETGLKIILNLDHGKDFDSCKNAIDAGFDYVHFDGSKHSFEENVRITKELVTYAHRKGIPVEGEFNHIEGSSADHTHEAPTAFQNPELYTNPEQALDFVSKTGVDVLAVFIGNLHGIYASELHLNLTLFEKIINKLPQQYFSLHGGSGISSQEVVKAISMGIVKVNINSEMRIAFKMSLQETLNNTNEIAVYKIMDKPISAVQSVVETKIKLFGSHGKL